MNRERTENRDRSWPSWVKRARPCAWKLAVEFQIGNEWVWSMGTPLPRSYDGMRVLRSRLIPQLKGLSNEAQLRCDNEWLPLYYSVSLMLVLQTTSLQKQRRHGTNNSWACCFIMLALCLRLKKTLLGICYTIPTTVRAVQLTT